MPATTPSYRLIAAGLILILYFLLAAFLLFAIFYRDVGADRWSQTLVIFNAVGALATTAAGVLLGVEIQQDTVKRLSNEAQSLAAAIGQKDGAAIAALSALGSSEMPDRADAGFEAIGLAREALLRGLGTPVRAPTDD